MLRCPFCNVYRTRIWIETESAIALPDASPIADGHTLVVPRKHVSTIYQLAIPEQTAIWKLVGEVRKRLLTGLKPDGFSIGFTDTLQDEGRPDIHAAVHIVPRRDGDSTELRGGIEWVTDDRLSDWKR